MLLARYRAPRKSVDGAISKPKLPHLLILRPSLIGPALREPSPSLEILAIGSTPLSTLLGYSIYVHRAQVWALPIRQKMGPNILVDECPVDLVTNRLLAHTSLATEGPVRAVIGRGAHSLGH